MPARSSPRSDRTGGRAARLLKLRAPDEPARPGRFVSSESLVISHGTTPSSRACPGIHRRAPEFYDGSRIGAASRLVRDDAGFPKLRRLTPTSPPDDNLLIRARR